MAVRRERPSTAKSVGIVARRLRCATEADVRQWGKFLNQDTRNRHLTAKEVFQRYCSDCVRGFRREQGEAGTCLRDNGLALPSKSATALRRGPMRA